MRTQNRLINRQILSTSFLFFGLIAPLAAIPMAVRAQEVVAGPTVAPAPMSWRAALDQSLSRLSLDDIARAQADEVTAAEARANRRFAGPLEADGGLRQDVIGNGRGYIEAEAGVMAPLWRRGERALLREQASSGGAIARLARDAITLEAAGDLRAAWWAYAEARDVAAIDAGQVSLANDVVAQVRRLEQGGEMARLDLRQAEIAAANAAEIAAQAQGKEQAARIAFEALAGQNAGNLPEEVLASAISVHPKLALAQAEAGQARSQARLASLSAVPRWRVGVDVRAERGLRGEDLGVSTGVRAAVPLGPDYGVRAEAASNATQAARADVAVRRLQLELDVATAQARAGLSAARTRLAKAETAATAANDALALTQRGRREGELSFIEELRARAAVAEATRNVASARVGVSAAISKLNQSLGLLP